MIIFYDVKHREAICSKFVGTFLTSYNDLVLKVEASTCSKFKEGQFSYCRKFLAFDIVVII